MEAGLKNVDGAVDEYKRQNDLINLQAQFMGCVWCRGCVWCMWIYRWTFDVYNHIYIHL